ncbi:unnamed protein product [Orchesella dallaii]|uniref:Uncharacterized protein n=1 Tax=Orchesella dallaii TaxID=48710 RepID=A0ABP1SA90_9HEXA
MREMALNFEIGIVSVNITYPSDVLRIPCYEPSNTDRHKLDVQGRFEQLPDSVITGEVKATRLTAIAAKSNESVTVEVRMRPRDAQWRYKLDVIVDNHRVFFDRFPPKIQTFPGL